MSDDLHPTRLWWCATRGRGIVRHDGVEVRRHTRPPVLLHVARIEELEYLPGIACMYVQEVGRARRALEDGEAADCLAYLRAVSEAAHHRADVGA